MKICLFGDSIAKGVIFDEEKGRYALLSDSFANTAERTGAVEIDNFAAFGCTVEKGRAIFDDYYRDLEQYDYSLFLFGGNDCDYNWAEVADDPSLPHMSKTPKPAFREIYCSMIKKTIEKGVKPVLLSLPPIHSVRFLDWFGKGLDKLNILKFLGDVEHISRWQESYSDIVCGIAEEKNIPLLDIRSVFFKQGNITDFLCADGIHPNRTGHRLIYGALAESTGMLPAV